MGRLEIGLVNDELFQFGKNERQGYECHHGDLIREGSLSEGQRPQAGKPIFDFFIDAFDGVLETLLDVALLKRHFLQLWHSFPVDVGEEIGQ